MICLCMEHDADPFSKDDAPEAPAGRTNERSATNGSGSSSVDVANEPLEKGTVKSSHRQTGIVVLSQDRSHG
jgi:hypothetical protein